MKKPDLPAGIIATDERLQIADSVRRICDRFDDEWWLEKERAAEFPHEFHQAMGLSGLEDYKSVSIGSLSVTTAGASSTATGADRVPPIFERYLTGLRISGPGNFAIKRS